MVLKGLDDPFVFYYEQFTSNDIHASCIKPDPVQQRILRRCKMQILILGLKMIPDCYQSQFWEDFRIDLNTGRLPLSLGSFYMSRKNISRDIRRLPASSHGFQMRLDLIECVFHLSLAAMMRGESYDTLP